MVNELNYTDEHLEREFEEIIKETVQKIKVIGCGGGGCNTITRLYEMGVASSLVELIALNTDVRHLIRTKATKKILIGKKLCRGLGAGKNPKVGEEAAKESEEELRKLLEGTDLVFITCGLGGGTGTGSAPVVARIAKEQGALVVAVCTIPFSMEGRNIWENARYGIEKLEEQADMIVVIPNDKLLELVPNLPITQAFKVADEVLANAIRELVDLVIKSDMINVDFADVRSVIQNAGYGMIGTGESDSENRALEAVERALANPLLDVDVSGAKAALIRITGSSNFKLEEASKIIQAVSLRLSEDARIIWGVGTDESLNNTVRVTVIVTNLKGYPEYVKKLKGLSEGKLKKPEKKIDEELGIEIIEGI